MSNIKVREHRGMFSKVVASPVYQILFRSFKTGSVSSKTPSYVLLSLRKTLSLLSYLKLVFGTLDYDHATFYYLISKLRREIVTNKLIFAFMVIN